MENLQKNNLPLVSIVVPCRNEEKFIEKCLESILNQDYPKKKLEILIVDGMSDDRTRNIIENYKLKIENLKLLDNPKKITPCAFNIGIKQAKGEIIIIMAAHSSYEKDYISKCVKYLNEYDADNVGGVIKTLSAKNRIIAKAITISLSHIFGTGGSYFRMGVKEPRWVDTVFGGCYRREIFDKIGFFDERLVRNQDLEFNLRLRKAGGKILLVPDIVSYYYPKSNLKDFFKHNFKDGFWVTYPLKFGLKTFSWRHLMPLFFVSGLIGSGILGFFLSIFFGLFFFIIGLYLLVNIYFSVKITIKEKNLGYLFLTPITFVTRHVPYGLGSIWGLIKAKIL